MILVLIGPFFVLKVHLILKVLYPQPYFLAQFMTPTHLVVLTREKIVIPAICKNFNSIKCWDKKNFVYYLKKQTEVKEFPPSSINESLFVLKGVYSGSYGQNTTTKVICREYYFQNYAFVIYRVLQITYFKNIKQA